MQFYLLLFIAAKLYPIKYAYYGDGSHLSTHTIKSRLNIITVD